MRKNIFLVNREVFFYQGAHWVNKSPIFRATLPLTLFIKVGLVTQGNKFGLSPCLCQSDNVTTEHLVHYVHKGSLTSVRWIKLACMNRAHVSFPGAQNAERWMVDGSHLSREPTRGRPWVWLLSAFHVMTVHGGRLVGGWLTNELALGLKVSKAWMVFIDSALNKVEHGTTKREGKFSHFEEDGSRKLMVWENLAVVDSYAHAYGPMNNWWPTSE